MSQRNGKNVSAKARAELDRHFEQFEKRLPTKGARLVHWVRQPSSRRVRIPVAVVLMGGGVVGFLPILGFWMLPLGLLLIAQDIPVLQKPLARTLGWVERKWLGRKGGADNSKTPE